MNFLTNIVLDEDDNIDLLLSMLDLCEEKTIPKHHTLDYELEKVICDTNDDDIHYYTSQLYQTLLAFYGENLELKKRLNTLTICNELLKSHVEQNVKSFDPESMFSD